jgi:preprotein translocase subunit SecE
MADTKTAKRGPLRWFREARAEFKKVTWPTPKQTFRNTTIVLGILIVAGAAIWGFDQLLSLGFRALLGLSK